MKYSNITSLLMLVILPLNILLAQTKPGFTPIDDPNAPNYWRTGLYDIEKAIAGIKNGKVEIICLSAGGRPVYQIFYGEIGRASCRERV